MESFPNIRYEVNQSLVTDSTITSRKVDFRARTRDP